SSYFSSSCSCISPFRSFISRPPPTSPLFPYTTLFRSALLLLDERAERAARRHAGSPLARAIRRSSAGCEYRTSSFHRLGRRSARSEEHTSELQSRGHLVCRLLLEKKKKKT